MWRFILELLRTETKRESMRKSRSETIRERKRETTHQERVVEMWRSLRRRWRRKVYSMQSDE